MWLTVGTVLRFANLTAKPPWTDEFATFVYSLGNSFQGVPLDRAITLSSLFQPLHPNPSAGIGDVARNLLLEDVHPPLYFVLAHLWMQLFPAEEGLISLWGARSLPALLGVASIPSIYYLSRVAFRSQLVGHLAAAMMAVSPYGIFLAQEARHYTLATLWVIASLGCLMIAARYLQARRPLPIWLGLTWVAINTLGISTHYFVLLTLCAEASVLIVLGHWSLVARNWISKVNDKIEVLEVGKSEVSLTHPTSLLSAGKGLPSLHHSASRLSTEIPSRKYQGKAYNHHPYNRWRLIVIAAGTLAGSLVWLPQWQHTYGTPHINWLHNTSPSVILQWINPVFQSLAAWITMISLLPVESTSISVMIASGFIMLLFFIWVLPILSNGLKNLWQQPATRLATAVYGGVILGAIALFFAISYGLGLDITRGARYHFVYFPAVIALLGAILAVVWSETRSNSQKVSLFLPRIRGKQTVVLILLMGFVSGLGIISNLGYQKYYRPDLLVPTIQQSHQPVLIATTHKTLVQVGEMMGLAWEFKRRGSNLNPQFLLAHQEKDPETSTIALKQTLTQLPQPLDLWLVNFDAPVKADNCAADLNFQASVNGYRYELYHCH
jgi:uncharacterized membrane protein